MLEHVPSSTPQFRHVLKRSSSLLRSGVLSPAGSIICSPHSIKHEPSSVSAMVAASEGGLLKAPSSAMFP